MLDVACGRGRHALAAARLGLAAVGLDRSAERLAALADRARSEGLSVLPVRCDLETGHGLPLRPASCGAVLVFRYLYRPLAGALAAALRPGGLLLYETFTIDQRDRGRGPRNPEFLLARGELTTLFPGLAVLDAAEGAFPAVEGGPLQSLARLAARRPVRPRDGAGADYSR